MKKNVSSQSMDATLQTFLGDLPSKEMAKSEPQPAATQEQASEAVQQEIAMANEPMTEQTDETPQVVRRISGKQRRASLEEYKETFPFRPSKTASPYSSAAARAMPSTASSACSVSGR